LDLLNKLQFGSDELKQDPNWSQKSYFNGQNFGFPTASVQSSKQGIALPAESVQILGQIIDLLFGSIHELGDGQVTFLPLLSTQPHGTFILLTSKQDVEILTYIGHGIGLSLRSEQVYLKLS